MIYNHSVRKNNNLVCASLIIVLLSIFLSLYYIDISLDVSDYSWSVLFMTVIGIIIFLRVFINKGNIVSLYSLFFLTSLLFIGGRFISVFLGYSEKPLFELDFFVYRNLDVIDKSKLSFLVISGFLALEFGYYVSKILIKDNSEPLINIPFSANKYLLFILTLVMFFLLSITSYNNIKLVLDGGYLALFSGQNQEYGLNFSGLLKTILLASTGIFLSQKNEKNKTIFLIILGLYYLSDLFTGGRGGFITYLLFLVWYKNDCGLKRASVLKFFSMVLILLIFLSTVFGLLSLRNSESAQSSIYQKVLSLIYDQGVSMMVFNESLNILDYPIVPYFQNFIPGFSFLYSKIVGSLYPYEYSFSAFISYTLNPYAYSLGYGMGWSFFSDAYLYGLSSPFFFCFWVSIFSIFLNYLQINVTRNIYIKLITTSLVSSILFLPRAGINTVFPLIPYVLVLFFIVKLLSGSNKK